MIGKQKPKNIAVFIAIVVGFFAFQLLLPVGSAYAEYTVSDGSKCQDQSAPSKRTDRTTHQTTYVCQDSTKTGTNPANPSAPVTQDSAATDTIQGSDADKGVTCAVEKIGWIVCPIMEGAAKISDKAFDILADNFLHVDTQLFDDQSGTKIGWEVARNLGNIMFIIAFLIIIVSQVTGRGLNNYGIKKMLPRLIIAAIAVNVSYYICQLAVDLTNILGYEIQNMMAQIANTVGPSVFGSAANYADTQTANTAVFQDGALLTLIVTGALAVGAVVWFMLPTLAALIPLILITVMVIIIILLLRKALIVLLIVLSPIAFVMYLLPNTEKYFSKWMSMFGKLLMVFPTVGLLFGAGQLASTIVLVSASSSGDGTSQAQYAAQCNPDDKTSKDQFEENKKKNPSNNSICGEGSITIKGGKDGAGGAFGGAADKSGQPKTATWTTGLIAMGIAVAPLLAVWSVLQGALSAAGAIGGKITSAVSKGINGTGRPLKSGADALGKRLKEDQAAMWQRSQARGVDGKGVYPWDNVAGGFARRRGNRAMRQNLSKNALDRATNHAVEGNISNLLGGLSDDEVKRAERAVKAQEDHHAAEETKNALTAIEYSDKGKLGGAMDAFDAAIGSGDKTQAKAAISALMTTGEKGIDALADKLEAAQKAANISGNHELANTLKEYMLQAHGNIKEKNAAIAAWTSSGSGSTGTVSEFAGRADTYAKLTDKQFSTQSQNSLASAGAAAALDQLSATADGGQESRGYRLLSNTDTANELNDVKRALLAQHSRKI